MKFGIAHSDTKMRVMQFSMQGEDILKLNNDKCLCSHLVCKRKIFLSILNPSVICVHFRQLVVHLT